MTIAEWLVDAMVKLHKAGVQDGRTDCLLLLADLFQKDKSWIHAHPETELDGLQVKELNYRLAKRQKRIPLAYIRGYIEFYKRRFTVNTHVLIPRPESESFINLLLQLQLETAMLADIGTGSGCLGITAALEMPDATVDMYDLDPQALAVAQYNAAQYSLDLQYKQSDILVEIGSKKYDVLMANLPYVPDSLPVEPELSREPSTALFSGNDGMTHYQKFWMQAAGLDHKPKYILTESLEDQHEQMVRLALDAGYLLSETEVLVQVFRLR
jgi:release factor glutamine methyltransferase